jgi:hypothetical protein
MRIDDLLAIARQDQPDITEANLRIALDLQYSRDLLAAQAGAGKTDLMRFVEERVTEAVTQRLEQRLRDRER